MKIPVFAYTPAINIYPYVVTTKLFFKKNYSTFFETLK